MVILIIYNGRLKIEPIVTMKNKKLFALHSLCLLNAMAIAFGARYTSNSWNLNALDCILQTLGIELNSLLILCMFF